MSISDNSRERKHYFLNMFNIRMSYIAMDEWMDDVRFNSISTVFQSNQDNDKLKMKGKALCNGRVGKKSLRNCLN